MDLVTVIERLGMGAGVLFVLWWVLNNLGNRFSAHEERSSAEHQRMITALDGIVKKVNGDP